MFFKKAKRYMLWRIIKILGIEFLFISIWSTIHVVFNHSAQLHEFGKRRFIKEWKGLYLEIVLLSIKTGKLFKCKSTRNYNARTEMPKSPTDVCRRLCSKRISEVVMEPTTERLHVDSIPTCLLHYNDSKNTRIITLFQHTRTTLYPTTPPIQLDRGKDE